MCFCGGVGVVSGGVRVVVFLWWCWCGDVVGGGVFVVVWWCFCGGVLWWWWWCGGVFVVVWWCTEWSVVGKFVVKRCREVL